MLSMLSYPKLEKQIDAYKTVWLELSHREVQNTLRAHSLDWRNHDVFPKEMTGMNLVR